MKIVKKFQGTVPENKILDTQSSSQTDAYSCNFVNNKLDGLIDIFYPVGSYYETSNTSFNPNTAWGGTWVEDTPGRFTLATGVVQANTDNFFGALSGRSWNAGVGSKGGQDYSSNPLSDNGHAKMTLHGTGKVCYHELNVSSYNANFYVQCSSGGSQTGHTDAFGAGLGGKTDLGNNMPPYICVKRWHRTA